MKIAMAGGILTTEPVHTTGEIALVVENEEQTFRVRLILSAAEALKLNQELAGDLASLVLGEGVASRIGGRK